MGFAEEDLELDQKKYEMLSAIYGSLELLSNFARSQAASSTGDLNSSLGALSERIDALISVLGQEKNPAVKTLAEAWRFRFDIPGVAGR